MRLHPCVAATALALALSALAPSATADTADQAPSTRATATPARVKAPKVTIKDLPASSEVGTKIKVTGTAKPGRSGRATVKVQQRYGTGAWSTVATKATKKSGKYVVRVPLVQGGPTSFRVKRSGGGTSKVETLAVYEWLDLAAQPMMMGLGGGSTRVTSLMGGQSYPESIELFTNNLIAAWSVAGCTSVDFSVGFTDRGREQLVPADHVELRYGALSSSWSTSVVNEENVPVGPGVHHTVPVTPEMTSFAVSLSARTAVFEPPADVVIGSPRARCNAAALPAVRFEDTPFATPATAARSQRADAGRAR